MTVAGREAEPQVFVVRFSGKRSPVQDLADLQTFMQQWLQDAAHGDEEGRPADR